MKLAAIALLLLLATACSRSPQATPVKQTENALTASLSRDGRFVAYTTGNVLRQGLRVRDLSSGADREIFAPELGAYEHLRISPDNRYLYFSDPARGLYRVALEGGDLQRIVEGKDTAGSFSPDGKRLVVAVDGRLAMVDLEVRSLLPLPVSSLRGRIRLPSWSPDGSRYAFVLENDAVSRLYVLPAGLSQTWVARRLGMDDWSSIADIAWLPDNRALLIAGVRSGEGASHLWEITHPGGTAERIGAEENAYLSASLSANGRLMATVLLESNSELLVGGSAALERAWRVAPRESHAAGNRGLAWTADGRLIYAAMSGGRMDIWVSAADGYQAHKLTSAGNNWLPRVTADGRTVVFLSDRSGQTELWRMDLNGGRLRQVSRSAQLASPDGKWIFDKAGATLSPNSADARVPGLANEDRDLWPAVCDGLSPDGKLVAVRQPKQPLQILDAGGRVLGGLRTGWQVKWSPDSSALSYLDESEGAMNLWVQPLKGPRRQITHFTTGGIVHYAWSRDGRWLAVARGSQQSRVAMIEGIR